MKLLTAMKDYIQNLLIDFLSMEMFNLYFRPISIAVTSIQYTTVNTKIYMKNWCALISKKIVVNRIVSLELSFKRRLKMNSQERGQGRSLKTEGEGCFYSNVWREENRLHIEKHTSNLTIGSEVNLELFKSFKSSVQISVEFWFFYTTSLCLTVDN